jgi:2-keto-3-deoxy-L-rhamnonate aldolase RhmA
MSKRKTLKDRFLNTENIYAAWTAISDTAVSEIFSRILNPDFVVIDLEHSVISLAQAQTLFNVIQANDCCALPRLSSHESNEIGRLLDAGADGIIAPSVNNLTELESIISAMKYPPIGRRGYGVARAQAYGYEFKNYATSWNDESILMIIVETAEAVNNIDALLENEHVDGIIIGEYDLSGSLNTAGDTSNPLVLSSISKIINSCKKHNKTCGVLLKSATESEIKNAQNQSNLILLSTDILILSSWAESTAKTIRNPE